MRLSTAQPEALPDIQTLRRLTQSLAMLDAILCPEWQYRYYSFDQRWDEAAQAAFMRNGCGDEWRIIFHPDCGALLTGASHEYFAGDEGVFAEHVRAAVPAGWQSFLKAPNSTAFVDFATFCLWWEDADRTWRAVAPPVHNGQRREDGSTGLLAILDGEPSTYRRWAIDYYERNIVPEGVQAVYEYRQLDAELMGLLNPEANWACVKTEAAEIGYPVAA